MDIQRAKEIIESDDRIRVKYEGLPVWIEKIDESAHTAQVHVEDSPGSSIDVGIQELYER